VHALGFRGLDDNPERIPIELEVGFEEKKIDFHDERWSMEDKEDTVQSGQASHV
jgi:hypothetical protein